MSYKIKYDFCPLCEANDFVFDVKADCSNHPLYKAILPSTMTWMRCKQCDHMFLDGYFNEDGNKIVFSETHENQKTGYDIENQRKISSKILDKIIPFKNNGSWLDVGFGNASLLFTAQEYGFYPVGVDLRLNNVKILNSLGIEAYCENIQKIDFKRNFSVISLMDVLEHVPYPKEMLSTVKTFLEPNGIIVISMPNTENIVWKEMTKQNVNPYLGELEHYHNFSRTRLYSLLEEFSIKPIRYSISDRYRVCMEIIAQNF